jgi:hypothetical protein
MAIGAAAGGQYGVISLAQLLELGLTRRAVEVRLRLGRLVQVHRSVYAVGHVALTPRARDLAAVLACGPQALLSHRSAATSWQLLRSTGRRIEVTAPRGRKPHQGITLHRSRLIHLDDRAAVDGIPTPASPGRLSTWRTS